jgi:hypothetical protein
VRQRPMYYVGVQPLARLRGPLAAAGRAGCVVVLPQELCESVQVRPSFEVAGCYGFSARARAGSPFGTERAA